jgi:adenylosuccinate synthase
MNTNNMTILGLQWGDEGKGKVVDCFAGKADIVARFGGGANAGHTVVNDKGKFVLHLLPSGIIHDGVICYMGGGMVVDPAGLFEELEDIESKGISIKGRLFIDFNTHLVLPQHKGLEKYSETLTKSGCINTTLRGIGPAYADKSDRIGITAGDLLDEKHLAQRVENFINKKKLRLSALEDKTLTDPIALLQYLKPYAEKLRSMTVDATDRLRQAMDDKKQILFEGAQGSLLDIGLGTYPFVTSSNTTIGGLFTGLGMPPGAQGEVLGVVKAYTTRVGNGPFPTELDNETGIKLRESGGEYGATTGRPRRCGWLDLAITRRTAFMSGVTGIVITKLDVLDGFSEIKVGISHSIDGENLDYPPLSARFMAKAEPVYKTLKGWPGSIAGIRNYDDLPAEAKDYIKFIESEVKVPVKYISTGSDRDDFIKRA